MLWRYISTIIISSGAGLNCPVCGKYTFHHSTKCGLDVGKTSSNFAHYGPIYKAQYKLVDLLPEKMRKKAINIPSV